MIRGSKCSVETRRKMSESALANRGKMLGNKRHQKPPHKRGSYYNYALIYDPSFKMTSYGRCKWEHCYVMERHLGRELTASENVHHINGIKTDDRPENLIALNHSEHTSLHRREVK